MKYNRNSFKQIFFMKKMDSFFKIDFDAKTELFSQNVIWKSEIAKKN